MTDMPKLPTGRRRGEPAPPPYEDASHLLAYQTGRRDALHEAAQALEMSPSTIRLHAGEMSAQEMRTVQAVLAWLAGKIRSMCDA